MNIHKSLPLTGLAISLLALTACQAIPKKQTEPVVANPQLPIDMPYETFSNQTISTPDQPSIAQLRWQDFYTDTRLKKLIEIALENNKDINAQILAVQKARANYQIKDITDIPTLNSSGGFSRSGDFNGNTSNRYSVNVGLSAYEFDFWGKIANQKESALQSYFATQSTKDNVEIGLIASVAQSYVSYSYNLAQLELAKRTLATRKQSLDLNQKRFQAGIDSELTSVQAQASVEQANIAIATAETNLQKDINALRLLLGTNIDKSLLPPPAVASITSKTLFNTGLPSDLLLYRPDIVAVEHELKSAGANVAAARASFFPTISLSNVNIGTASGSLSNLFKSGTFNWGLSPSISLPIFDGGARRINYEVAEITQKQMLNNYEKTIQSAFKEVNDVLATRSTLNVQMSAYQKMLKANQKNLNIATARFKAGLDNYLGVLEAERGVYSSQQSILNTRQAELNSQINLYKALGGGVNFTVPLDMPPTHKTLADFLPKKSANNTDK